MGSATSSLGVEAVVRQFVDCINAHDPRAIAAHCSPDHVFTDSLGAKLTGHVELQQAWAGYFQLFPDYLVEVETIVSRAGLVLLTGWASATFRRPGQTPARSWRIPAAWRALVIGGLVAEWQVFADNKPVYEILAA